MLEIDLRAVIQSLEGKGLRQTVHGRDTTRRKGRWKEISEETQNGTRTWKQNSLRPTGYGRDETGDRITPEMWHKNDEVPASGIH
jgi:hypothetical protein